MSYTRLRFFTIRVHSNKDIVYTTYKTSSIGSNKKRGEYMTIGYLFVK